jgi:hypothetical protein
VTASVDGGLTGRCLERLAAPGVDTADLIALIQASEHLVASYGDRYVTRPALLGTGQVHELQSDLSGIFTLLASLPQRLFGGDLRAAGRAAGMIPYQIDAVERTITGTPACLGRADLYREPGGFRLLEFNLVSAVGGLEIADLNRVLLNYPALAAFVAESGLHYIDTMARIAEVIKAEGERIGGRSGSGTGSAVGSGSGPVVAIVDTPSNFAPFADRFRFMADIWSAMGLAGIACPLDQLEERSGRLFADGRRVDVVYRYFLIEDLLDPASQTLIEPVLRAAEKGHVALLSRMDSELYGSKAMMALLSDEANRSAFTAAEADLIDRILPWTAMLRPGPVTVDGEPADLMAYALASQSALVLKPTLMHGGIGVVPGWTTSAEKWREYLQACSGGPYILQRRVRPVTEPFPVPGQPGAVEPLALNWGVFLVGDRYAGTLIRGAADPDVGVLSRATGARVGCCFHQP